MQITLELTRETLRGAFGRESFIASFIKTIHPTTEVPTACITAEGLLRYNPEFATDYVKAPCDVFCLVCHELMHPMFGHFIYHGGEIENLAADMVINAAISLLYYGPSNQGSLFRAFYDDQGIEGLLRPLSVMHHGCYDRLYGSFYGHHYGGRLSTGEVIHSLKVLTPVQECAAVVLLGSHMQAGRGQPGRGFPAELRASIADDLERASTWDNRAGYGQALHDLVIDVFRGQRELKRELLRRYTTKRKLDRFLECSRAPRISVSPVPVRPSKRDLVLLCAGVPPFYYHNRSSALREERHGLAVYLDVSGSVHDHLPEIIGLLRRFQDRLTSVFLFSNAVVESTFEDVCAGRIKTTIGTDFDCIARSLIEKDLDKAVILTDGHALLDEGLAAQLEKEGVHLLTLLFGDKTACPEFAPFGPVAQLEDACA